MFKKHLFKKLLILLLISLSNFALAQERVIFPISSSYTPAISLPVDINRGGAGSDLLQVFFNQKRSYECAISVPSAQPNSKVHFFSTTVIDPDNSSITATATGRDYPALAVTDGALALSSQQHSQMRLSLIAEKTGLYSLSFQERISGAGAQVEDIRCRETTLYGSYNRFFAQAAIVEIQNASSNAIPAFISIVDAAGTVVINNQAVTAAAGTRTDIIFASLPANNYGQIVITHTAPFGALSGYVAEYDSGSDGSITLKRERPLTITPKADSSTL